MSYIVQALRKLEQERRRVTVTEMTLFRGLSERWKSETPVWRYLLVLSVVVNTGLAVWLLFFFGGSGKDLRKLNQQDNQPPIQSGKAAVATPHQRSLDLDAPAKLSLEVSSSQRVKPQSPVKASVSARTKPAVLRPQNGKREVKHYSQAVGRLPQDVKSADEIEMHESSEHVSPNVVIWKDEKGNIHYSGMAGKK